MGDVDGGRDGGDVDNGGNGGNGSNVSDLRLGGLVAGTTYQPDPGEEENSPQNAVHKDRLYMFRAFGPIGKNNGSDDQPYDTQNGQCNTQYSFFHISSKIGLC